MSAPGIPETRVKNPVIEAPEPIVLRMTRTFDAPRDLVWRAWTQPEHLLRWFAGEDCVPVFADMDVKPGGKWRSAMRWSGGKTHTHLGEYLEIDPPHRLVFTHHWEEDDPDHACQSTVETRITVTLTEQGGRTHMVFEQVGLASQASRDSHEQGWGAAFTSLDRHCLSKFDEADREIVITRHFDAPRERVWRAWTEPVHIARWFGPRGFSTRVDEQDFHPGGRWRYVMTGPDGTEYPCCGVFREIVPQQLIVSTDEFDENYVKSTDMDLPQGMVVHEVFETEGRGTRVILRICHPTLEDRRKHEAMGVVPGWGSTLDCLAEHLATMGGA